MADLENVLEQSLAGEWLAGLDGSASRVGHTLIGELLEDWARQADESGLARGELYQFAAVDLGRELLALRPEARVARLRLEVLAARAVRLGVQALRALRLVIDDDKPADAEALAAQLDAVAAEARTLAAEDHELFDEAMSEAQAALALLRRGTGDTITAQVMALRRRSLDAVRRVEVLGEPNVTLAAAAVDEARGLAATLRGHGDRYLGLLPLVEEAEREATWAAHGDGPAPTR